MRNLIFYISGLFLLVSCARPVRSNDNRWAPLGNEIDSLTALLDSGFSHGLSLQEVKGFYSKLEDVADTSSLAASRKLFWKSMITALDSGDTYAYKILESALTHVDSTRFPYDHLRISSLLYGQFHPATVVRYSRLLRDCEEYNRIGDTMMLIRSYNRLGQLLFNIGEQNKCLDYVEKALTLAREGGYDMLELSQLNNKAVLLTQAGKTDEAIEIMKELDKSDQIKNSDGLYYDFCCNATYILQNPAYLKTARRIYPDDCDRSAFIDYLSTLFFENDYAFTDSITATLWANKDSIADEELKSNICYGYYLSQKRRGDTRAAFEALEEYDALRRSIEDGKNAFELMRIDKRHEIDMYNSLSQSRITALRLRMLLIILVVAIFTLVSAYMLKRYILKVRLRQRRAQAEIEQNRRGLTASRLSLEEKDKVIDEINRRVHTLEENGNINRTEARQINNVIQIHRSGQEENENFVEMFSKIHPNFVGELRKRFPAITDSQEKLAMYLIMGLNSKQIARMLMIQPEAVKKRRYRLRLAMGLETDQSLENTLKEIADSLT